MKWGGCVAKVTLLLNLPLTCKFLTVCVFQKDQARPLCKSCLCDFSSLQVYNTMLSYSQFLFMPAIKGPREATLIAKSWLNWRVLQMTEGVEMPRNSQDFTSLPLVWWCMLVFHLSSFMGGTQQQGKIIPFPSGFLIIQICSQSWKMSFFGWLASDTHKQTHGTPLLYCLWPSSLLSGTKATCCARQSLQRNSLSMASLHTHSFSCGSFPLKQ